VKYCNCGHSEYAHGGLITQGGYEPKHCTAQGCECDELTPIKLTHAELCRLSQVFHANSSINTLTLPDARIAEWLKDQIREAEVKGK